MLSLLCRTCTLLVLYNTLGVHLWECNIVFDQLPAYPDPSCLPPKTITLCSLWVVRKC